MVKRRPTFHDTADYFLGMAKRAGRAHPERRGRLLAAAAKYRAMARDADREAAERRHGLPVGKTPPQAGLAS